VIIRDGTRKGSSFWRDWLQNESVVRDYASFSIQPWSKKFGWFRVPSILKNITSLEKGACNYVGKLETRILIVRNVVDKPVSQNFMTHNSFGKKGRACYGLALKKFPIGFCLTV
jgi:hypothetical protein